MNIRQPIIRAEKEVVRLPVTPLVAWLLHRCVNDHERATVLQEHAVSDDTGWGGWVMLPAA